MKSLMLLIALMLPLAATAQQNNINLPGASRPSGFDEIRTSSGSSCKQASGSNLNFDVGVVGSSSDNDSNHYNAINNFESTSGGNAVYARLTYAIGAPARLPCKELMDLEIEQLQMEVQMLREQMLYGGE